MPSLIDTPCIDLTIDIETLPPEQRIMGCFGFCKENDTYTTADKGPFMQSNPAGNPLFALLFPSLQFSTFCTNSCQLVYVDILYVSYIRFKSSNWDVP